MSYRRILRDIYYASAIKSNENGLLFLFYHGKFYMNMYNTTINMSVQKRRCLSAFTLAGCRARMLLNSRARLSPSLVCYRSYNGQGSNAGVFKKRLWRVIRGIFLATGGLVWLVAFVAYISLEKVNVDMQGEGLNGLERRLVNRFYNEKDEEGILKKDEALDRVWSKLNKEERIKDVFGSPVYMCGYNYSNKIEGENLLQGGESKTDITTLSDNKDSKTFVADDLTEERESNELKAENLNGNNNTENNIWEAGCYIEGPKNLGILKVIFEEYNKEWVPIAVHLETLQKSGQVITDVSGSVPNGLKNFTRLTN